MLAVMARLDRMVVAGELAGPEDLNRAVVRALAECLRRAGAQHPVRSRRLTRVVTQHALHASAGLLAEAAAQHGPDILREQREQRAGFQTRLRTRWGKALDLLELHVGYALEAGVRFHGRNKPAEGDWTYNALIRLHARACLIAGEVQALLGSGFASGAHARWRTLHEVAVVAFFIAKHGQDTARRYTLHDAIESCRAAGEHQQHAAALGQKPIEQEELNELEAERDALLAEFGPGYGTPYGWASAVLGGRPTFRDIEVDVALDQWRPYYRMASHATHAGPKALSFDLGLLRTEVMLAGPSNAGLADPGDAAAISLFQVTVALLNLRPDAGDVATMLFLGELTQQVGDAFFAAHDELARDEERLREGE